MMDFIGKGLVTLYTALCLVSLSLAGMIFFEFVDWGRAEPRSVRGEPPKQGPPQNDLRIASEYDKSVVVLDVAAKGRDLVLPPFFPDAPGLKPWHEAQTAMAYNHLYYVDKLKELNEGSGDIVVKALPDLTSIDKPVIGKPKPSVTVEGLDKSKATYREMLKAEIAKLQPLENEVRGWADEDSKISYRLTGKDEGGKKQHGLFELVDDEFNTQQRLIAERDYLEPLWAGVREEAQRYRSRRESLEVTLNGLDKALKAKRARER